VLKAIKIRLYPTDNQIIYINKLLGSSRYVYNQCLNYKINEYLLWNNATGIKDTGKYLTELKQEKRMVERKPFKGFTTKPY